MARRAFIKGKRFTARSDRRCHHRRSERVAICRKNRLIGSMPKKGDHVRWLVNGRVLQRVQMILHQHVWQGAAVVKFYGMLNVCLKSLNKARLKEKLGCMGSIRHRRELGLIAQSIQAIVRASSLVRTKNIEGNWLCGGIMLNKYAAPRTDD